jgi:type VI protein secretion system component VasK
MLMCAAMETFGTDAPAVSRKRWQHAVTLIAVLGVILVLTNMILFERNRSLQNEVTARAQYIQQTVQLEGLHREIINAIANLSVRNKDDALRTILTQQGITINMGQPPPGAASVTPAPEKGHR